MGDMDIPLNADKILFVETLVNYVFRDDDDVYLETIPEDQEYQVHNAFTLCMKHAVEFLEVSLGQEVDAIFRKMEQDGGLSEEKLIGYAAGLRKKCFRQGFDCEHFLNYCVHIAMLACKFHQTDTFNVAAAAVSCIMACFEDYDMLAGGWDTLQNVAKKFERAALSMPTPSPSSDDDYLEEYAIPEDAELSWIKSSVSSSDENDDWDA